MTDQPTAPADDAADQRQADDQAQPEQPQQQLLDPFAIAGEALGVATGAFNLLAKGEANRETRVKAATEFERAVKLSQAASSFCSALVARQQWQQHNGSKLVVPGDLSMRRPRG